MATTTTIQDATTFGYLGAKTDPAPNSSYTLTGAGPALQSPVLKSIAPDWCKINDPGFVLQSNGAGFLTGAVIVFGGTDQTTTVVSASKVTATIPSTAVLPPGISEVWVRNADGKTSNIKNFEVLPA